MNIVSFKSNLVNIAKMGKRNQAYFNQRVRKDQSLGRSPLWELSQTNIGAVHSRTGWASDWTFKELVGRLAVGREFTLSGLSPISLGQSRKIFSFAIWHAVISYISVWLTVPSFQSILMFKPSLIHLTSVTFGKI